MTTTEKSVEVGQEVFTRCTKCKTDMYHVITALADDGSIKKVMCKGCESNHLFKGEKTDPAKKAQKAKAKAEKMPATRTRTRSWDKLVVEIDNEALVNYEMGKDYSNIAAINHKKFGVGVIRKILSDRQMEVIFKDGSKVLVQNYK